MRVKFIEMIKNTGKRLLSGIKRFPEALILAAIAVAYGIYLNHFRQDLSNESREILMRITMILSLGVPLSLCIKVLFERIPRIGNTLKVLIYAAGIAGLALYYQFLLKDFNLVPIARYVGISLALYLIFTFLPYFLRKENYELHIIKLLTSFIITYLYSLILYLGLIAIIFTIDKLFTANISSKVYFDIFLIVAGVFALGYFLSGIPKQEATLSVDNYPKVLKVLLLNIVMPLTLAYSLILYAYFIKILVTWNWPSGLVSNLVLWFSIISTAVIFLIYSLKNMNRWVMLYVRWTPALILPLMVMMYVSIGIRINAYGFTENRYFVVVAGLWVTGCMIYLLLRRNSRNIVITASLALIAILSVTGPWSSFSISMLSQNMRLESVLKSNGMLKDNTIVKAAATLKEKDKNDITGILIYFNRNHSLKDVKYLPKDFNFSKAEDVLGFKISEYGQEYYGQTDYFNHNVVENSRLNDIKGYDYFLQFPYYKQTKVASEDESLYFEYLTDKNEIIISKNKNVIYTGKPDEIAAQIHKNNAGKELLKADDMRFVEENSDVRVLYLFRNINGSEDKATGKVTVNMPEFDLFIKLK